MGLTLRAKGYLAGLVCIVGLFAWRMSGQTPSGPANAAGPEGSPKTTTQAPVPIMAIAPLSKSLTETAPTILPTVAPPPAARPPIVPTATDSRNPADAVAALIDHSLFREHKVLPGQTLKKIATLYRVTPELLTAINGLKNANRIRNGGTIKVVQGPFRAEVSKETFDLTVFLGKTPIKTFHVGLGANDNTPVGVWRVMNKLTNPAWVNPLTRERYAADDPSNPIGEHWLGLEGLTGDAIGKEGFGIHATIDPTSIGRNQSLGCVRMTAEDVAQIYAMLVEGASTVEIK